MDSMVNAFFEANTKIIGSRVTKKLFSERPVFRKEDRERVTANRQYQKGRDFAHDIAESSVGSGHRLTRDEIRQDIMGSLVPRGRQGSGDSVRRSRKGSFDLQ